MITNKIASISKTSTALQKIVHFDTEINENQLETYK